MVPEPIEDTDRATEFLPVPELFFSRAVADVDHRLRLALLALDDARPPDFLAKIVEQVADSFRIPLEVLKGRSRIAHVAFCRQVAMFMCRRAKANYPVIGEQLDRDHATVMHGCALVQRLVNAEPAFRLFVEKLERQITGTVPTIVRAA